VLSGKLNSYFEGQLSGVFRAIRGIYHQYGFFELYRGHLATLARVFPYASINFMAFEQFKLIFGIPKKHLKGDQYSSMKRILSGSLAGTVFFTLHTYISLT